LGSGSGLLGINHGGHGEHGVEEGVLRYVLRSGKEGIFFLALKYSSVLSVSSVVKLFMPL
jgi:hypothetical protein